MKRFEGRAAVVLRDNIDTDQIIPARFLRTTTRAGLGAALFADRPEFLNGQSGSVLVAGENFGCGSSREHAPWALLDAGFRAVVAPSIADIFRQNAIKNGLVPVQATLAVKPGDEVTIDLEACTVNGVAFPLDPFARHCLIHEIDELGYLLGLSKEIDEFEARR